MLTKLLGRRKISVKLVSLGLFSVILTSCGGGGWIPDIGIIVDGGRVVEVNITADNRGRSGGLYFDFNDIQTNSPASSGKFFISDSENSQAKVWTDPANRVHARAKLNTPCARGFLPQGTPFEVKVVLYDAQGEVVAQQSGQVQVNCTYHGGLFG